MISGDFAISYALVDQGGSIAVDDIDFCLDDPGNHPTF